MLSNNPISQDLRRSFYGVMLFLAMCLVCFPLLGVTLGIIAGNVPFAAVSAALTMAGIILARFVSNKLEVL